MGRLRDLFSSDFGVTEMFNNPGKSFNINAFNPYQWLGDIKRAIFGQDANAQGFKVGEG